MAKNANEQVQEAAESLLSQSTARLTSQRYLTRAAKAKQRESFTAADVDEDDIINYLLNVTNFDDFVDKMEKDSERGLAALWACRNEWAEAQKSPQDPEYTKQKLIDARAALREEQEKVKTLETQLNNSQDRVRILERRLLSAQAKTNEAPQSSSPEPVVKVNKTTKIPDPPVFTDGKTPTFDAWKRAMRNKLRTNVDHFPTDEAQLGYVLSRVEQPASDILEPYAEEHAANPLRSAANVFELLELVYGTPNKEHSYQIKFDQLTQGNMEFNAFVAEFYRLSGPLRRDESSLIAAFKNKVTNQMYNFIIGKQKNSLTDLIEYCREVDEDLKAKQSRLGNTFTPFRRNNNGGTSTNSISRRSATPDTKKSESNFGTRNDRSSQPPTNARELSNKALDTEREQMMRKGQCFNCHRSGHRARDCPQQAQQVNETAEEDAANNSDDSKN